MCVIYAGKTVFGSILPRSSACDMKLPKFEPFLREQHFLLKEMTEIIKKEMTRVMT